MNILLLTEKDIRECIQLDETTIALLAYERAIKMGLGMEIEV